MSDADTEERRVALNGMPQRDVDPHIDQPTHRRRETAHARQHNLPRVCDRRCVPCHGQHRSDFAQPARDVRNVRDRRIDERHVHESTPFVLGTSLDTIVFASLTAIAKALKIASAA